MRARRAQGLHNDMMPYVAPLRLYGTYFALVFCIIVAVFKNFDVFVHDPKRENKNFDYKNFITGYLGIPLYLIMLLAYKYGKGTREVTPTTADFVTGKDVIDAEERDFLEKQAQKKERTGSKFYDKFVSWLF